MDRFNEMRVFNAVVEAGSFVKAAEALNLSKAAVSRLVIELEARLGVRLLHRTTRRLSLTDEGQAFHARSRDLLAELEAMEAEITSRSEAAHGLLRINAPYTFGILELAPLWSRFHERHPRVMLDVTLSDRVVDLVDEGYDLAIRIAMMPSSSLVSRHLTDARMVLCASPTYLKRKGVPTHPSDLSAHAVAAYSYLASRDDWTFQGPEGDILVRTAPWIRTNNGDTCVQVALAHQAVVLQPSFLVAPHLASGALVELLPGYRSLDLGIHAVYPSRRHLPAKVRVLIDFLIEQFRDPDR